MEKYFSCARGGGQTFNTGIVDLNYLKAFFIEQSRDNFDAIKQTIDGNARAKGWLIFATHDVCDQPTRFGCFPGFFEKVVDYAIQSKATILPVFRAWQVIFGDDRRQMSEVGSQTSARQTSARQIVLRPRESQNVRSSPRSQIVSYQMSVFPCNQFRSAMRAIENNLFSFKDIGLRSYVQLLEAVVKVLSHHVTRRLNALSAGLRPVEGLIDPRRFHYCRPGGIAFTPGVVRHHPAKQNCPLAGQRWRARRYSHAHHDLEKYRD